MTKKEGRKKRISSPDAKKVAVMENASAKPRKKRSKMSDEEFDRHIKDIMDKHHDVLLKLADS